MHIIIKLYQLVYWVITTASLVGKKNSDYWSHAVTDIGFLSYNVSETSISAKDGHAAVYNK